MAATFVTLLILKILPIVFYASSKSGLLLWSYPGTSLLWFCRYFFVLLYAVPRGCVICYLSFLNISLSLVQLYYRIWDLRVVGVMFLTVTNENTLSLYRRLSKSVSKTYSNAYVLLYTT